MEHNLSENLSRSSSLIILAIIAWLLVVGTSYRWNSHLIEQAQVQLNEELGLSVSQTSSSQVSASVSNAVKISSQRIVRLQRQNTLTHGGMFLLLSIISTLALLRIVQLLRVIETDKKLRDDVIAQKTQSLKKEVKQHKHARNELQRLATHDPLTGLRNRRHFIESLDKELNRYQRYQSHFSLLMLDIDLFSQVNDTYGHKCGDYVLQQFAKTISGTLRQSDIFVRYGGEEFAIITTSSQLDSAMRFAVKLIAHVNSMIIDYQGHQIKISVSIGVSSPSQIEQPNSQQLVALADKALHQAKSNGRNQAMSTTEVLS